ncbi:hypothetical protein AB1Y20_022863 [Prymnesium parvum]|uniref:ABC transporter domain-containing protein n=1 Tax=Prymnesium parvum TaxID=97485 RepID=A0AB34JEY9_PRYPA
MQPAAVLLVARMPLLLFGVSALQIWPSTPPQRCTRFPSAPSLAVTMLAKKKKSKVDKAASAALAALEAMEASAPPQDLMLPVEPVKKKKLKKKDLMPPPPPATTGPAAAPPVKASAPAAPAGPTMAEKVAAIKAELGLDESLPVARAVSDANAAMGIAAKGTLADQVQELLDQLGLELRGASASAAAAPSVAPPAPSPPAAPSPPPASVSGAATEAPAEEAKAEGVEAAGDLLPEAEEVAEEVAEAAEERQAQAEGEVVQADATGADAEPAAADGPEDKVVTLSKKKQSKKKVEEDEEDGEGTADPSRDQSGRRGMGTKRIEKMSETPADFAYIKISDGKLRFRNQEVLRGVTWDVQTGQRVGLVGDNGAGKTTQLKVLSGELELDEGELIKSSADLKVSFLRQEFREDLNEQRTLREELTSVFSEVQQLNSAYAKCERDLAAAGDDTEKMQAALDEMAEIQTKLDTAEAGSVDRRVDKVMGAMGFTAEDGDLPVSAFSGGWKMRIGLAKILLQEPSVLLLDEPTNHMDLESVEWLERYLIEQTSNLALVIVSHDREFLDRVCTRIVETEQGVAYPHNGNYRSFLKAREQREELKMRAHERQQKEIRELKAEINNLRKLESAAPTVRAKERQLKAMEPGGAEHIPRPFVNKRKFSFRFPAAKRSSQEVIELEEVSHGYGNSTLFSDINLAIERGDRIAILGANGAGKSTLLRLIMGREQPREGRAEIVAANAETQFFEQDQANVLPLDKTVIETLEDAARSTDFEYEQLRALLGKFMFKDEKVNDLLSTLSGGEKARVALCRMMLTPCNLLLLDEPTNHLDIAAKEVLEEAIHHFEGTVVMVSHDRFFISQTANTILALEDGELVVYEGDYRSYMERNEDTKEKVEARYIEGLPTIKSAKRREMPVENEDKKKKKNFGGKGPSGNKAKGIKNAKRQAALT